MRRRSPLLTVCVLALLVWACGSEPEVIDLGEAPAEGQPALPADDGLDVAEAPSADAVPPRDASLFEGGWPEAAAFVSREAEQGRPTLVNIFASWCEPCRDEVPLLLEARDEHPDVSFLGIDHQDRLEDGAAFVAELGIDFPTIHDLDGDVAYAVGARGMPTTVAFDADGRLTGRVVGELTPTSLDALLAEVR